MRAVLGAQGSMESGEGTSIRLVFDSAAGIPYKRVNQCSLLYAKPSAGLVNSMPNNGWAQFSPAQMLLSGSSCEEKGIQCCLSS